MDFQAYDTNGDSVLQNRELSVFAVLNLDFDQCGAGAQANINLGHTIADTGIVLEKFARTRFWYSSIGVNVHELGHHIFGLKHFAPPGNHGMMSSGAYAQDPVVGDLIRPTYRWGTRPTGMISFSQLTAGLVSAVVPEIGPEGTQLTLNSINTGQYNVIRLPTAFGSVLLENRESLGYDASIPFCDGHAGGMFMTEGAQLILPVNVAESESRRDAESYVEQWDICGRYSVLGHNDTFAAVISSPTCRRTVQ